jgi:DNA repair protein RecO (recombination protein O)
MNKERTYRSEAIVLRRTDIGEADRLLTLYSREYGKIRAVAKGARKPQTRKTGHVELFMRTAFMFAQGKSIDIITQAELIEAYPALRQDLVRTTYAAYCAELLDGLTADEDRDVRKYSLLADGLGWIAESDDLRMAARYYELRLLALAGYQPQLFHCVSCNEKITEQDQFFSAELGGILCPDSRDEDRRARPISAAAVKLFRYLQTRDWETVHVLRLRKNLHQELEGIMHYYLRYVLEHNLRSIEFLYRLRREADILTTAEDKEELSAGKNPPPV